MAQRKLACQAAGAIDLAREALEPQLESTSHRAEKDACRGCTGCKLAPSPGRQTSRMGGCTRGPHVGFLEVEFTWVAD